MAGKIPKSPTLAQLLAEKISALFSLLSFSIFPPFLLFFPSVFLSQFLPRFLQPLNPIFPSPFSFLSQNPKLFIKAINSMHWTYNQLSLEELATTVYSGAGGQWFKPCLPSIYLNMRSVQNPCGWVVHPSSQMVVKSPSGPSTQLAYSLESFSLNSKSPLLRSRSRLG